MLEKLLIHDTANPAIVDEYRFYNLNKPRLGTTKQIQTPEKAANTKDISFYSQERVLSK